jgi:hypothetical protein
MTDGHLHLRRFVAPAGMINHRLHSSRFIVRGKRGANSRLATVEGRRAVFSTPALIQGWLRAPNWQVTSGSVGFGSVILVRRLLVRMSRPM